MTHHEKWSLKEVFRRELNIARDVALLTLCGNLFRKFRPAALNAQSLEDWMTRDFIIYLYVLIRILK